MTVEIDEPGLRQPTAPAGVDEPGGALFPARVPAVTWSATTGSRDEVAARLARPPFVLDRTGSQGHRVRGVGLLLDWLSDQPGHSWQQRWMASGADAAAAGWRRVPADWLHRHDHVNPGRHAALCAAVTVAIAADVVRPSLGWLVAAARSMAVVRRMVEARDVEGFARLRELCDSDPQVSARGREHALHRGALIIAAKGGMLGEITIGDVLELLDTEARIYRQPRTHGADFYRMMRRMGVFGPSAPHRLAELRPTGRRTPEELIDRYQLACRPVRDLLVEYLKERQPGLDYSSTRKLAAYLGNMFWKDLERHHPGIDSLRLPAEVAEAWKQRLRTVSKTVDTDAGERHTVTVERVSYRQCLTPVRALYLDLAQWAIEDPARWARWIAPCPIGGEEINQRKLARHRKARMDTRTRERLPVLPELVRSVAERRRASQELLCSARQTRPGQSFTAAGQSLTRSTVTRTTGDRVWADDPTTGKRRDLTTEEDIAFWAWAVVEVLRTTGIRVEELLEISHHSMVRYRLPTTGELVPLLQIAPSKTDAERLLVIL